MTYCISGQNVKKHATFPEYAYELQSRKIYFIFYGTIAFSNIHSENIILVPLEIFTTNFLVYKRGLMKTNGAVDISAEHPL